MATVLFVLGILAAAVLLGACAAFLQRDGLFREAQTWLHDDERLTKEVRLIHIGAKRAMTERELLAHLHAQGKQAQ